MERKKEGKRKSGWGEKGEIDCSKNFEWGLFWLKLIFHLQSSCFHVCRETFVAHASITTPFITAHSFFPRNYFFAAVASSALAFALFSRTPTNLASLLASLNTRYAFSVPVPMSDRFLSLTAFSFAMFRTGSAVLRRCIPPADSLSWNALMSSLELSPFLCLPLRRGNRISRAR